MAFVLKDRVKQATTTTGTGNVTLATPLDTFDAFSTYMSTGDTTYYAIVTTAGVDEWEVGLGTLQSDGTLARTTVFAGSSGADTKVNFGSGQKDVFMTYAADKAAYLDSAGNLSVDTDKVTEGTTNQYFTDARAQGAISVTDAGGDGSLAYSGGTITYTGPSASEVRAHFSAGEGIDISAGAISGEDATTTNKGIASFDTNDFTVTSGAVSVKAGSIENADVSATAAIADTKLDTISTAGKVSNSATTATNLNTASAIVARDASGNFTAGTVTAALTGNADTATALETARTIGGVSFDGTANINLPGVNTTGNQNTTGSAATLTTARTIGGVSFDGSANIDLPGVNTAGNQNTTGSAATLTTARTIGGVSFDGSANISLPGVDTAGNQDTSGTATNATNINISANTSTDTTTYPVLVGASTTGNQAPLIDNADLSYNASTGTLSATAFSGDGSSLSGISSGGLFSAVTGRNLTRSQITPSIGTYTSPTANNVGYSATKNRYIAGLLRARFNTGFSDNSIMRISIDGGWVHSGLHTKNSLNELYWHGVSAPPLFPATNITSSNVLRNRTVIQALDTTGSIIGESDKDGTDFTVLQVAGHPSGNNYFFMPFIAFVEAGGYLKAWYGHNSSAISEAKVEFITMDIS